jgi:glycosyltransferase involved in cell wall biosynthesis
VAREARPRRSRPKTRRAASTLEEVDIAATAVGDASRIEVAWLGARPGWLDGEAASTLLDGISVTSTLTSTTHVAHLSRDAEQTVAEVRTARPGIPVVVDLGTVASLSETAVRDAATADVVLVESERDAEQAGRSADTSGGKILVAPAAVDLEWYVPEAELNRLPGAYVKRFRRLHRLAHPMILFIGPYTPAGGLDVAIAATYRLRERFEHLRLAAVPLGSVDQKFLDRCEMDALALGHRGIIEWTRNADDLRVWYATATVVCCPWREAAEAAEAPVLAAAAARPFVGSDLIVFRQAFRAPGAPPLVAPGSVAALVDALAPLLGDLEEASRVGGIARSAVEDELSPAATARRLGSLWSDLAERSPLNEAA